ncbi:unnamed protein product [Protopolystoma xenopodis]|uniref:Laminin G domain-containing protein n=1 Tax=Protopolystoma xenopodis TaxID=117903 RepID=A0A3S5CK02_9PLAT|nr:unnamed protein product [Protopolystoma xenopodis]
MKMPQFLGTSYIRYSGLEATSGLYTSIRLTFRPNSVGSEIKQTDTLQPQRQVQGLLLYQGFSSKHQSAFLVICLHQGNVVVSYDLGSGPATLRPHNIIEFHLTLP